MITKLLALTRGRPKVLLSALLFPLCFPAWLSAQECACNNAIQVSVEEDCSAVITASMLLASNNTCGGPSTTSIVLMATPTGQTLYSGQNGSVLLADATPWINKTIYAKVTSQSGNSCWTEILVEDKMPPVLDCPEQVTIYCHEAPAFSPVVHENCSSYNLKLLSEYNIPNVCSQGYPQDVLKVIQRTYQATDASNNVSAPCEMQIIIKTIPEVKEPYIGVPAHRWMVDQTPLLCDEDYARIPAGQPFEGHPSPVSIGGKNGTGTPKLLLWTASESYNGKVIPNGRVSNAISLKGGSDNSWIGPQITSQVCFTARQSGNLSFSWDAAVMDGLGNPGGSFLNNEPAYSINGNQWNLATSGSSASGQVSGVALTKGDQVCFRVYSNNTGYSTMLNLKSIVSPNPVYLNLFPTPDNECGLMITFEDLELPPTGCVTKIMRNWQVVEWSCRNTQRIFRYTQFIEIADTKGPTAPNRNTLVCPGPIKVNTGHHQCDGTVQFPSIALADNCSNSFEVDILYPGGSIRNQNGGMANLPVGCHVATYKAYDACKNFSTCEVMVTVEDRKAPVAVCNEFSVVGLTSDGQAWISATVFDEGSYDECEFGKLLVRRMEPSCQPCKTPEFPGFRYLGTYVNGSKTHYYYVSQHKATPGAALNTGKAMGGYVVSIGSANENTFVYDKVKALYPYDNVLIGLRDPNRVTDYQWESGESSAYRNWAAGAPSNGNEYVYMHHLTSKWQDFQAATCSQQEYRYVVEITDPCGFSSHTNFCCADIGSNKMVVMRAVDKQGNWNECMVNVTVQDKLAPRITCPPDMDINCVSAFDTRNLRQTFGWPQVTDNCETPVVSTDSTVMLTQCRIGFIERNFTARDKSNRTASCTQRINVRNIEPAFEFSADRWPADVEAVGCSNPNDDMFHPNLTGKPNTDVADRCALLGTQYDDQVFTFNNPGGQQSCFKILRHWTVIDWCQEYTENGIRKYKTWKYTQTIKVADKTKPVIVSSCARKEVCTVDPNCANGFIELTASATDNCTDVLKWTARVDLNNDGTFNSGSFGNGLNYPKSGDGNTANMSGTYPIGNHRIEWIFEDRCGNLTKCEQLFDVVNCKAPTPYCINGLATDLMPVDTDGNGTIDGGMIEVWASDFDRGSSHPCGYDIILSFEPVVRISPDSLKIVPNRMFTCATKGRSNVQIYAAVVTPMGRIEQAFCSTFIDIQDNMKACPANRTIHVQGSIYTEASLGVDDVEIELEGSEMMDSTILGDYAFSNLLEGASYIVKPAKTDDILNGVSTLDLVFIQRHILGMEALGTPYKLIAADINADKKINTGDLVELRKAILGVHNTFPGNQSWRFVDKSYSFIQPDEAQGEPFREVYDIQTITEDMKVDFVAVKIGDVNDNAKTSIRDYQTEQRTEKAITINLADTKYEAGKMVEIPVTVADATRLAGVQFTMNFSTEHLELQQIRSGMLDIEDQNLGYHRLHEGLVSLSWSKALYQDLGPNDVLFTLVFKSNSAGSVYGTVGISSDITSAEAYTDAVRSGKIGVEYVQSVSEPVFRLYQNVPNPFKQVTSITFELPAEMDATVSIQDITGKVLKTVQGKYAKGMHTIQVNKQDLAATGLLYYTLEAGIFKDTQKMILVD